MGVEQSLDKIRKSSYFWFVAFAVAAAGQWYQVQGFVAAQTIINIDQKATNKATEEVNRQRDIQITQLQEQTKSIKEGMEALDRRVTLVEGRR